MFLKQLNIIFALITYNETQGREWANSIWEGQRVRKVFIDEKTVSHRENVEAKLLET